MPTNPDPITGLESLPELVRKIILELDPGGSGYFTVEASRRVLDAVVGAGVCDSYGKVRPNPLTLMRLGSRIAVANYEVPRRRAVAKLAIGQGDFAQMASDFEWRWLFETAALDETEEAIRKVMARMTYYEVWYVIGLNEKKAVECGARATRLRKIMDDNPHWRSEPNRTMADILGIEE